MNKLPWARFAAEFGVIVVGVLVALLAESAWQERGERSDEPEVLERISAELGLDSAIILDDVDWFGQLVPILEEARAVLRGESDLTPGPALAVVFTAGLRRTDLCDPRNVHPRDGRTRVRIRQGLRGHGPGTAEPQRGPRHPRERPVTAGPGVPSRRLAAESR